MPSEEVAVREAADCGAFLIQHAKGGQFVINVLAHGVTDARGGKLEIVLQRVEHPGHAGKCKYCS